MGKSVLRCSLYKFHLSGLTSKLMTAKSLFRKMKFLVMFFFLKNGPNPASFQIFVIFQIRNFRLKNCKLQRDSNADRWSRRWAPPRLQFWAMFLMESEICPCAKDQNSTFRLSLQPWVPRSKSSYYKKNYTITCILVGQELMP